MKSNSIEAWLQDGLIAASRYQKKIAEEGINSAKSLGERISEKDCKFYSLLFKDLHIDKTVSILDIGCGKAELLPFLKNNYSKILIDHYLGIDLVEEFLDLAKFDYPEHKFQQVNFVSDQFRLEDSFTIVVALGVLVSRVRAYTEFVEYFIKKMVQCSSDYVLFNAIAEVDLASPNYFNCMQVGRSTFLTRQNLESILN